jgi:hypothetical protein
VGIVARLLQRRPVRGVGILLGFVGEWVSVMTVVERGLHHCFRLVLCSDGNWRFQVDVFTTERVSGPINCRIEGFEPRVSQDDSVMTNVGNEET